MIEGSQLKLPGCKLLFCLLLVGGTLLAYWPVQRNEFVNYDDQQYVTENPQVLAGLCSESWLWAFRTTHAANWHPLTWVSHMLDVQCFGKQAAGHHLTSAVFHAINTLLLFLFLSRSTRTLWRSTLVAGLFALHPLHVESVAWIAERKDVLSAFFGLLCLIAYVEYAEKSRVQSPKSKVEGPDSVGLKTLDFGFWTRDYLIALLCFALGLMSKPMLVTLPFVLLLLDYWPLGRVAGCKVQASSSGAPLPQPATCNLQLASFTRLLWEKWPFFVLAAGSSVVTLIVQQNAMMYYKAVPFSVRAANAVIALVSYLRKTVWPQKLAVLYPYSSELAGANIVAASALVLAICGLVWWLGRKRPWLVVGWLWFVGMLIPVIGLVQVGVQAMADRYTYLPLIGLFIIFAWSLTEWVGRWPVSISKSATTQPSTSNLQPATFPLRVGAILFPCLLLVACAAQTRAQLRVWHDTETLFVRALSVTRHNWVAHYNLALLAMSRYQQSQRSAVEQQVLQTRAGKPNQPTELGATRDYLSEVITHCQAAMAANPAFPDPRITLAKAFTERGELALAQKHLEIALQMDPKSSEAHENLGELFLRQGHVREAVGEYQQALKLKPDWEPVLNNLAWLLATDPNPDVRDGAQAVRLAERACQLTRQTNFWFLQTLAAAYAEKGDFSQAVTTAEAACRLVRSTSQPLLELAEARLAHYKSGRRWRAEE